MNCSPQALLYLGVFQARILEWVAMLSSRDLPDPGIEPESLMSPALAGRFFTPSAACEALILLLTPGCLGFPAHPSY